MKRPIAECFLKLDIVKLLALMGYGEASIEPTSGIIGVMSVAMNRVKEARAGRTSWWGKTLQEVILKPKQFSCFNPTDKGYLGLVAIASNWDKAFSKNKRLRECFRIADGVIDGAYPDNVFGATHYNTLGCDPTWDDEMKLVATLGHHEFFCE